MYFKIKKHPSSIRVLSVFWEGGYYLRSSVLICGCFFSQRESNAYPDDGDEQVFEQSAAFALDVAENGCF